MRGSIDTNGLKEVVSLFALQRLLAMSSSWVGGGGIGVETKEKSSDITLWNGERG